MVRKCKSALLFQHYENFWRDKKKFFHKSKKNFFSFWLADLDSTFFEKRALTLVQSQPFLLKTPKRDAYGLKKRAL